MFVEALQARLKVVDDEILRLTMLASKVPDKRQLDDSWDLAQALTARGARTSFKDKENIRMQSRRIGRGAVIPVCRL
jgi:hypothetical protein